MAVALDVVVVEDEVIDDDDDELLDALDVDDAALVVELTELELLDEAANLYICRAFPPPQYWNLLPGQTMLHLD